eukprot:5893408-Pleurochrysis_carterae.AAC.2
MGHGQAFTAVCAEEGYMRYPNDPIGCFLSVAMFYAVPKATDMETMIYTGLQTILGCRTESSRLCRAQKSLFMYIGMLWHNTQYIQTKFIVGSLHSR